MTYTLLWAVIDIETKYKVHVGEYKTKKLAESACFNLNTYGPEAEQLLKDIEDNTQKIMSNLKREKISGNSKDFEYKIIDTVKINHASKPKRHSNKRLISLN